MTKSLPTASPPKRTLARLVVRAAPRDQRRAILQAGSLTIPAALGRSGRTSRKREGDGATPIGVMRLLHGYHRNDRVALPPTCLPSRVIGNAMLWCDAPGHACYNRPVRAPFAFSHECLKRSDELYDVCIVMDWNIRSRKRSCGSAIFFHIARPGYTPTEGCVAISLRDMRRLLPHMGPDTLLQVL